MELDRLNKANTDILPPQISIRSTIPGSVKGQVYRLLPWEAWMAAKEMIASGVAPETILFDESAPDHRVTLQCEIMRGTRCVYEMRYALHSGMGMRQAYNIMSYVQDLTARTLVRRWLDENSLEQLDWILENYPEHVIELSAYDCGVGVLGWNTLFWEVRPAVATRAADGRVPWT